MKRYLILIIILVSFIHIVPAITVDEILDNFETVSFIPNLGSSLTIKLISANGDVREIKADVYQKIVNENLISRLFLFDYPPSVRNTGLLINSFLNGDENVMWIYLPAVKRIKRIALATSGGGYFMGSDFSYSDFVSKGRDSFTQELLEDIVLDGIPCYVVKEYGKNLQARQDFKLSYMINYYRKTDFVMFGRDYYDLAGELLKEYRVKESIILGQYIYPTVIEMENKQTGHKSIIEASDISTDVIPDRYFTTRYLQNR